MFIHWGTYSAAARHEWVKQRERIPDSDYMKYFRHFDPDLYDPREWARSARNAGMKYAVITAKHHEGFCLWNTKYTDYKSTNTPYGKDLLKPMVKAFRAEGLRIGFYYSLLDWHHPQFTVDSLHPMLGNADERRKNSGRRMKDYAAYMRRQVKELLTGYGPIDVMWFDFSYPGDNGKGRDDWESEKLHGLVRSLQPDILINNRLDLPGTEDFVTPEQVQPGSAPVDPSGRPVAWEICQTFSGSWGYHRDELTWKSVPQLLWILIDGVSKGGNLLLNVGPTARGQFDDRARTRLEGVGQWMRYHARSIHGCGPAPDAYPCPPDCRYTCNPKTGRLYVHIMTWPFGILRLPGLANRVEYAQFLHDASEVRAIREPADPHSDSVQTRRNEKTLALSLPDVKPRTDIPVIELFLK